LLLLLSRLRTARLHQNHGALWSQQQRVLLHHQLLQLLSLQ
jgi:hypothetical protein